MSAHPNSDWQVLTIDLLNKGLGYGQIFDVTSQPTIT
jgi:hypothetical protein